MVPALIPIATGFARGHGSLINLIIRMDVQLCGNQREATMVLYLLSGLLDIYLVGDLEVFRLPKVWRARLRRVPPEVATALSVAMSRG